MALLSLARLAPRQDLDDLDILDAGIQVTPGTDAVSYFWYGLREREGGRTHTGHRVVRLVELRYLPQETRNDAGLVQKTKDAVKGLYDVKARFDLVQVLAGIFNPPLGIVQCYGVASSEPSLSSAAEQSALGLAALRATLANFVQSEFVPLNTVKASWLLSAMTSMKEALVAIGHPDPRQNPRGGGRESPDEQKDLAGQGAYTLQQNEMLFRGMSKLNEEFIWLLLAHRLDKQRINTMFAGIAAESSVWASRMAGSKIVSFGISVPIMLSGSVGRAAGATYGETDTHSAGQQVSDSHGKAHQDGTADTTSHEVSHGTSHQWGVAHTDSTSVAIGHTEGTGTSQSHSNGTGTSQSHTDGKSEEWGTADTHGGSTSTTTTVSHMPQVVSQSSSQAATNVPDVVSKNSQVGTTVSASQGVSAGHTDTQGWQTGTSSSQSTAASATDTTTKSANVQAGGSLGGRIGGGVVPADVSASVNGSVGLSSSRAQGTGVTLSDGSGQSSGVSGGSIDATAQSSQVGAAVSAAAGQSTSLAHQIVSKGSGVTVTPAHDVKTTSSSYTSLDTHTDSHSRGVSSSDTKGTSTQQSDTKGTSTDKSDSKAVTESHSTTRSEGWGESWGEAWGTAHTASHSDTESWGTERGFSIGRSFGTAIGRALTASRSMGVSGGVVPSLTATKSYNWTDDLAAQVALLRRTQQEMLRLATLDGGFLTDVYMLTRAPEGRAAAEAVVRQAFQGDQLVVTAVQSRRLDGDEREYIRRHAAAFTPSTRVEKVPGLLECYKDTTFLIPLQMAAYLAPGMYERGTAVTVQERIPPFAFYPEMEGDVVLGHQWDYETRELTAAQVHLSEERHMHTAFIGDTGAGKTVAAERLCVEIAQKWHHRCVVLDFGAGWRELLFSELPRTRVDIRQLYPGAVRLLRWNFLQVGRRIDPITQSAATAELVANAGQMGPRQLGYLQRALRELYLQNGVLTADRIVLADENWNHVRDGDEVALCGAGVGTLLTSLSAAGRQALAIHRSKRVDVTDWVDRLREYYQKLDAKATQDRQSLEGVILRLEPFAQGELALMYGKGNDSIAVEDLGLLGPGDDRWGVAIVEGGASLNAYSKSVLLGLVAWHLYNDAIVRQRKSIGKRLIPLNVFFEEANKILGGVPVTSGSSEDGRASVAQVAEQFQAMFRDGRKYGYLCHLMLQSSSEIAPGILSSCPNAFIGQTKALRDRDVAMGMLAKSEKGFTDEEYKRFISRVPNKMFVCKLGFTDRADEMEPMLMRPVRIVAQMPTDEDIAAWYAQQECRVGVVT